MDPLFLGRNLLSLLFRKKLHFHFDRIPLTAHGLIGKKRTNLFRIGINRILPIRRTLGWPYMAHICPAGACDLSCEQCPTHDPESICRGCMSFETFKKFIDEAGDYLLYLILWSWGEPLLNPDLARMVGYARERGILTVSSTNLASLRSEQAEALVDSGLDALIIALDGATAETHRKLRRGGDFDRVVANTRMLVRARAKAGARRPFLNLRMVVSRANEGEVDAYKRLARELGVDMVSFKAYSTRQSGSCDQKVDARFAPDDTGLRWYRYRSGFKLDRNPRPYRCRFPWTKPTLFPDGTVVMCEFDLYGEHTLGNINHTSFRDIWFGGGARRFRRIFQRDRGSVAYCRDCVYDHKLIPGCVLEWDYLDDAG